MSQTSLKRIASLTTETIDAGPRPLLALEHLESGTGRLLPGARVANISSPGPGTADVAVGDVLFGKLRPYLAKSWVADRPAFASTELLCLRPQVGVDSRWLGYVMASSPLIDWAVATSDGIKMPRTSWEKLGEFRVALPTLAMQRAIAEHLDRETARIDALIAAKRRMWELLLERERATLTELFRDSMGHSAQLRHFATVQGGLTVDAGRDPGEDAVTRPYLRVANVQAGRLDLEDVTLICVPRALASRSTLRVNDVLMTEGGDIDKLGRGTVWRGELEGCLHQNHIFAVRPDPRRLDSRYLALLTQSDYARAYFESTGVQSTNLASTSSSKILALRVPVLSVAAQHAAVDAWERLSAPTTTIRLMLASQIARLGERRQALITAAVTGQLNVPAAA